MIYELTQAHDNYFNSGGSYELLEQLEKEYCQTAPYKPGDNVNILFNGAVVAVKIAMVEAFYGAKGWRHEYTYTQNGEKLKTINIKPL